MSEGKNKSKERAAKNGVNKFAFHALRDSDRQATNGRYVIWCFRNLRPQTMMEAVGYHVHLDRLPLAHETTSTSEDAFNRNLTPLCTDVLENVMSIIYEHSWSCLALEYGNHLVHLEVLLHASHLSSICHWY